MKSLKVISPKGKRSHSDLSSDFLTGEDDLDDDDDDDGDNNLRPTDTNVIIFGEDNSLQGEVFFF
eukprot:Awhi_evm1s10552